MQNLASARLCLTGCWTVLKFAIWTSWPKFAKTTQEHWRATFVLARAGWHLGWPGQPVTFLSFSTASLPQIYYGSVVDFLLFVDLLSDIADSRPVLAPSHTDTHTHKKKTGLSSLLHFHCHTKNAFSTSIIPHFRFWLGQRVPVHDVSNSKRPPSSTFHHIRLGTPWWKRCKLVKPFYMQLWLVCGECWCLLLFFFNLFLLSQKKIMEAKWSQKTKEGHEKKDCKI